MGTEAEPTREEMKKKIQNELREGNARTVVVTGEAGVGKTWIAKEILKSMNSFISLWICSNPQDQKEFLMEKIRRQLSIFLNSEEWKEFCDMKKKQQSKEASAGLYKSKILLVVLDGFPDSVSVAEIMENLDHLLEVLGWLSDSNNDPEISKDVCSKAAYCLLCWSEPLKYLSKKVNNQGGVACTPDIRKYLDDFLAMKEEKLRKDKQRKEKPVEAGGYYKVLVTRRTKTGQDGNEFEIKPLSEKERLDVLKESVGEKIKEVAKFQYYAEKIAEKSKGLPAAIVMIAEALKRIARTDTGTATLEAALEEAATREKASDGVNPLFRYAYEMLPRSDTALINCWWQSLHIFSRRGGVHFNELIACWILEGCVGSIDRVEKAYRDGHRVLLELIGRGMLKVQYGNIVAMEHLALAFPDYRRDGYEGTSSLGLASVFEGYDWECFGEITRADGMINIMCNRERWAEESKKLHRLRQRIEPLQQIIMPREQTPEIRKGTVEQLERTLEQLQPTLKRLKEPEQKMEQKLKEPEQKMEQKLKEPEQKLKQALEQLEQTLKQLYQTLKQPEQEQTLNQIELKQLKQTLEQLEQTFKQPKQTPGEQEQTLEQLEQKLRQHEPALAFCSPKPGFPYFTKPEKPFWYFAPQKAPKESKARKKGQQDSKPQQELEAQQELKEPQEPQEPKELRQVCLLVLRGCDPDHGGIHIKEFKNLKVLEISGATSLKSDLFGSLTQLRSLNLSETKIDLASSSIFQLRELRWLILRNCSGLQPVQPVQPVLPKLSQLTNLEVLDLSGALNFKRFGDRILTSLTKLRVLDASQTDLDHLPILGALATLTRLSLRSCKSLTRLPKLDKLSGLQILDLSGAAVLEEIPSLGSKNQLKILNLSGTGLSQQSFTVNDLTNLESLDLSKTKITSLPSLSRLSNLEVLNLSDCRELEVIGADPFGNMTRLRCLNLSGTKIKSLGSLSKLVNLRQLLLKSCSLPKELPTLDSLSKLEELDLCGLRLPEGTPDGFPGSMTSLRRLDLSETDLKLAFLHQLTNLTELSLRRCLPPEIEPNLGACTKLEVLDLSETCIPSLPSSLKGLSSLRELKLRGCSMLAELRDLESLTRLEVLDLWGTGIRVLPGLSTLTSLKRPDLPDLKDPSCEKIFCMIFPFPPERQRLPEIVGFDDFREDDKKAFRKAKHISIIDNKFINSLSKLAMESCKGTNEGEMAMESCVLDRCAKMRTVFDEANNVSSSNGQLGRFKNLRNLYLDCCPQLQYVFASSQLPENLEILQIKFCDKLESLFSTKISTKCELPKLQKLHLMELPKLTSIAVGGQKPKDVFPSIMSITVRECSELKPPDEIRQLPNASIENSKIEGY